jgi:predicted transcriptional regulator
MQKRHATRQGLVATDSLETVYQREIFFQVDPATLDYLDAAEIGDLQPSTQYLDVDVVPFMKFLPELEQEIFYMVHHVKKNQKDIAKLLGLSQPTISYRYRRVLEKLAYIMVLVSVPTRALVDAMPALKDKEKDILHDLLYYTNQEMVGQKHGVRQSSVKWVFVKTKRRVTELERTDPEQWGARLGLLLLLERFMNVRVQH